MVFDRDNSLYLADGLNQVVGDSKELPNGPNFRWRPVVVPTPAYRRRYAAGPAHENARAASGGYPGARHL